MNSKLLLLGLSISSASALLDVPISRRFTDMPAPKSFFAGSPSRISDYNTYVAQPTYHEKDLSNYFNVQYYGSLYLGSNNTELTFIFDTGSSVRSHLSDSRSGSGCRRWDVKSATPHCAMTRICQLPTSAFQAQ